MHNFSKSPTTASKLFKVYPYSFAAHSDYKYQITLKLFFSLSLFQYSPKPCWVYYKQILHSMPMVKWHGHQNFKSSCNTFIFHMEFTLKAFVVQQTLVTFFSFDLKSIHLLLLYSSRLSPKVNPCTLSRPAHGMFEVTI